MNKVSGKKATKLTNQESGHEFHHEKVLAPETKQFKTWFMLTENRGKITGVLIHCFVFPCPEK